MLENHEMIRFFDNLAVHEGDRPEAFCMSNLIEIGSLLHVLLSRPWLEASPLNQSIISCQFYKQRISFY